MANTSIKALRKEAKTQLADNFSRALAVFSISLLFSTFFLMLDQIFGSFLDGNAAYLAGTENESIISNSLTEMAGKVWDMIAVPSFLISIAMLVFDFLITSPYKMGTSWWYYSLAANGNLQVGNVFAFYKTNKDYSSALMFEIQLFFKLAVYAILSFAPSVIAFIMSFELKGNEYILKPDMEGKGLLLVSLALLIVGLIVYIALSLNYFLARYLFAIGDSLTPKEAFERSKLIMHGDKSSVISMAFSLLGWYLSCIFIIPLGYVVPLHNACMARCARNIIEKHKNYESSNQNRFVEL